MDFVEQIYKKICKFFVLRNFVYRFDLYNGTEESNSIFDNQVVEYEFINQGGTMITINGGLRIFPTASGIVPDRVKLQINANERDTAVYQYRFDPPPYVVFNQITGTMDGSIDPNTNHIHVDFQDVLIIPKFIPIDPDQFIPQVNSLLVISKVVAIARK